jgi:hypothetical protein
MIELRQQDEIVQQFDAEVTRRSPPCVTATPLPASVRASQRKLSQLRRPPSAAQLGTRYGLLKGDVETSARCASRC